MSLQPMRYIPNRSFSTKWWAEHMANVPLPKLPPSIAYEPWEAKKQRGIKTYVMSKDEERLRFLELNWYKQEYNRLIAARKSTKTLRLIEETKAKVAHMVEYLVRVNLPLVYSQVSRNQKRYFEFNWDEGISEGQLSLLRAVARYDLRFHTKFSTYATRIILNCLMGFAQKKFKVASRLKIESLPENCREAEPTVPVDHALNDQLERLQHVLRTNAGSLTHAEESVIRARFNPDRKTLEELGEVMGLSKERVRQIQNAALAKLRTVLSDY